MKTDVEIARDAQMQLIREIAAKLEICKEDLEM